MKDEHLRKGNLLILDGREFHYSELALFYLDKHLSDTKLVELTPQWLERMGFELLDNKLPTLKGFYQLDISDNQTIITKNGSWEMLANVKGQGGTIFPCPQLKYVHQLQNLYFALTGKEIEIKQLERV